MLEDDWLRISAGVSENLTGWRKERHQAYHNGSACGDTGRSCRIRLCKVDALIHGRADLNGVSPRLDVR